MRESPGDGGAETWAQGTPGRDAIRPPTTNGVSLLIVGVSWPLETFLELLIDRLIETGFELTVACDARPGKEWLSRSHFTWLPNPSWDGPWLARTYRLACQLIRGLCAAPTDVRLFAQHARRGSVTERLRVWNRLLPFAGRRWSIAYLPWLSHSYEPLSELGIPLVVSCRGSQINVAPRDPRRTEFREALPRLFGRAAAVHCVSDAIEREARRYGLTPSKAVVIRPAVDVDFFTPSPEGGNQDEFLIVTTGSLVWQKGYEYALLAARRLADEGVPFRFEIIGDGSDSQRVLYAIHDLDLTAHVHLQGRVTHDRVRDRLRSADVFLLSSLSEGISNAVLEAMACGLPVVTTDCGGMREVVMDGNNGFVVPKRNPDAAAGRLRELWESPELRRRLGEAGRKTVETSFRIDQQVEEFRKLFTAVVGDRT